MDRGHNQDKLELFIVFSSVAHHYMLMLSRRFLEYYGHYGKVQGQDFVFKKKDCLNAAG